jgi:hypothetical protein
MRSPERDRRLYREKPFESQAVGKRRARRAVRPSAPRPLQRRCWASSPVTGTRRLTLRGSIDYLGLRVRSFGISTLELVTLTFASWNPIEEWLRRLDACRHAA